METPAIKSRCPKGTRRNKKTGNCEKIAVAVANAKAKAKVKSPVTTMKTNKQTGEKTKVKLVFAPEEKDEKRERKPGSKMLVVGVYPLDNQPQPSLKPS
jgi:hypothetical protein